MLSQLISVAFAASSLAAYVKVMSACVWVALIAPAGAEPNPKRTQPTVELLMFEGCPNSPKKKANLQIAMKSLGLTQMIKLVNILKLPLGDRRKGYGAPSLLVNGRELFGRCEPQPSEAAPSCRLYASGVPSAAEIEKHLRQALAKNRHCYDKLRKRPVPNSRDVM